MSQQIQTAPLSFRNDAPHLRDAAHAHLDAVINGRLRLHFDTHDAQELAVSELDTCDFYFKRSYLPEVVAALPANQRNKVLPLGLNYQVLPDIADPLAARRGLALHGFSRATLSAFKQAFDINNRRSFAPRVSLMEHQPDPTADPNVLFMVAAYDPHDDPNRAQEKIDDRISINETRARCIRLLREALGPRFTGGFGRSRYTLEHYSDLVLPPEASIQTNYLGNLRKFPICVASTGLHGSTGWKLTEYVAFSRAIVSERLVYEVPGEFAPGKNYIDFTSAEECVDGAVRLIEDANLRRQIMQNNATYYRDYVRPDSLVRNALTTALQLQSAA